jgi:CBS domain-containing protein
MNVRTLLEMRRAAPARTMEDARRLADAAAVLCAEETAILIVTRSGSPVGALSRGDILACLMKDPARRAAEIPIREAMTPNLVTVAPEDGIEDALKAMMAGSIRSVPVIEDGRVLGVLPVEALFAYRIEALTAEMRHLQAYISDLQDAAID